MQATRRKTRVLWRLTSIFYLFACGTDGLAATLFYDDFGDGNLTDGSPVRWAAPWGGTSWNAGAAGGVLIRGGDLPAIYTPQQTLSDISIRTRVRWTEGSYLGVSGRMRPSAPHDNYYVYVGPTVGLELSIDNSTTNLVDVPVAFEPDEQDIVIQLDLFGNSLQFWVWPATEPMPATPTGQAEDDSLAAGAVALWIASDSYPDAGGNAAATFRYVHVADTRIPEPATCALMALNIALCLLSRSRFRPHRHGGASPRSITDDRLG